MNIILASSSPSRKILLSRILKNIHTQSPDIDETPKPNENALTLVKRLSLKKAQAVAVQHPNAVVIGGDQVACCERTIFGKPHTVENAVKQLIFFAGKTVDFISGLCVYQHQSQHIQVEQTTTHVRFKTLTLSQIHEYLEREDALKCAGSFKSEGLGISLCNAIESTDPTAIIGLPLIKLQHMLQNFKTTQ